MTACVFGIYCFLFLWQLAIGKMLTIANKKEKGAHHPYVFNKGEKLLIKHKILIKKHYSFLPEVSLLRSNCRIVLSPSPPPPLCSRWVLDSGPWRFRHSVVTCCVGITSHYRKPTQMTSQTATWHAFPSHNIIGIKTKQSRSIKYANKMLLWKDPD